MHEQCSTAQRCTLRVVPVSQADEAAADPVVIKPVDSVTTVNAAAATAGIAGGTAADLALADPAGRAGGASAASGLQPGMAGAVGGTGLEADAAVSTAALEASSRGAAAAAGDPAGVVPPLAVAIEASTDTAATDSAALQVAASSAPKGASADVASSAVTQGDMSLTAATTADSVATHEPYDAVQAVAHTEIIDSGPRAGSVMTQSVMQPFAAGSDTDAAQQPTNAGVAAGAILAAQAASDPAIAAAAAGRDSAADEATLMQQPGMFGAQQRRQVVARLPRRGHAPLSEAQQRLQRQWQARDTPRCLSHFASAATACHLMSVYDADLFHPNGTHIPCVAPHAVGNARLQANPVNMHARGVACDLSICVSI